MPLDQLKVDDAFDDASAAYAEVLAKSAAAEAAPDPSSEQQIASKSTNDGAVDRSSRAPQKDERGRFAKRAPEASQKADEHTAETEVHHSADETDGDVEPQDGQSTPAKGTVAPPPSWTVKSKADWDRLPEHVRADIAKRESEVSQGFSALKDYRDLKPYAEMATKHGTTISAALKNYTGIETMLKNDLGQGIAQILQNFGLNQTQAVQFFSEMTRKYGGAQGNSYPNTSAVGSSPQNGDPLYNILNPFIEPLKQEVTSLRQKLSSREEADRNASQQSLAKAIETFSGRPENRYFSDLEETITRLFETGMVPLSGNHEGDLQTAYNLAAQMNSDVREALIDQRLREQKDGERKKEQEAASKAKQASRSLTGSRVPGTVVNTGTKASNGHDDVEADVRAAYRLHSQY